MHIAWTLLLGSMHAVNVAVPAPLAANAVKANKLCNIYCCWTRSDCASPCRWFSTGNPMVTSNAATAFTQFVLHMFFEF